MEFKKRKEKEKYQPYTQIWNPSSFGWWPPLQCSCKESPPVSLTTVSHGLTGPSDLTNWPARCCGNHRQIFVFCGRRHAAMSDVLAVTWKRRWRMGVGGGLQNLSDVLKTWAVCTPSRGGLWWGCGHKIRCRMVLFDPTLVNRAVAHGYTNLLELTGYIWKVLRRRFSPLNHDTGLQEYEGRTFA